MDGDQHALNFNPMARRSDPDGSHVAADEMERSGKADAQRRRALSMVLECQGRTTKELANVFASSDVEAERLYRMLGRRLPELRDRGVLVSEQSNDKRRLLRWWTPGARR